MDQPRPCIVEVTQIVPAEDVPIVAARVAERLAMPVERVQKLIDARTGPITRPLRPDKAEAIAQTFEAAGVTVAIRLATEDDEPEGARATPQGEGSGAGVPAREPPRDRPPVDEPPLDEPPAEEPPADEPPIDEPPGDAPPYGPPPDDAPERRPPPPPPHEDAPVPAEVPGREPDPPPADLPRRPSPEGRGRPGRTAGRTPAPLRIEPEDDDDDEVGEYGHPARGEVSLRRRPLVVEYGPEATAQDAVPPARERSSGVIPAFDRGTRPTFTDESTWGGDHDSEGAWILRRGTPGAPDATAVGQVSSDRRGDDPQVGDVDHGDDAEVRARAHAGVGRESAPGTDEPFVVDDPEDDFDDIGLPELAEYDDDELEVELDTGEEETLTVGRGRDDLAPAAAEAATDVAAHEIPTTGVDEGERGDEGERSGDDRDPVSLDEDTYGEAEPDDTDSAVVPMAWRGLGGEERGPARPVDARVPKRADPETLRAEDEAQRVVMRRTLMLWALVAAVIVFVLVQFWAAGRAAAGYSDGLHRFRDAQFVAARQVWTRLASEGDPNAQFMLGYMSETGLGQPWSARAAASWYRLAADAGHAEAQWRLGTLYARGLGVPWSLSDARRWWAAAAHRGHAEAAYALGRSYLLDPPVPDVERAQRAFALASELGRRDAGVYLHFLKVVSDEANGGAVR